MRFCKCDGDPMTTTLKIEHGIVDFETWKAAFERDPVGRQASGVRRYRVFRPTDDPKYVLVDLDFDDDAQARAFLEKLEDVWNRVALSPGLARAPGGAGEKPRARILEEVEARTYGS